MPVLMLPTLTRAPRLCPIGVDNQECKIISHSIPSQPSAIRRQHPNQQRHELRKLSTAQVLPDLRLAVPRRAAADRY